MSKTKFLIFKREYQAAQLLLDAAETRIFEDFFVAEVYNDWDNGEPMPDEIFHMRTNSTNKDFHISLYASMDKRKLIEFCKNFGCAFNIMQNGDYIAYD